jgi:hypothetical protein
MNFRGCAFAFFSFCPFIYRSQQIVSSTELAVADLCRCYFFIQQALAFHSLALSSIVDAILKISVPRYCICARSILRPPYWASAFPLVPMFFFDMLRKKAISADSEAPLSLDA